MNSVQVINAAIGNLDGIANLQLSLAYTDTLINHGDEESLLVQTIFLDN